MRRKRASNWLINVPVFVVVVLFLLGTYPAFADNSTASYKLDMDMVTADIQSNINATTGGTIELGVFAQDVTNLSNSNVVLEWDKAILTLVEAKLATNNLMTGSIPMLPDIDAANASGSATLTSFVFSGGATGSGYIFSVKFELKSNSPVYITMGADTAFSDLTTGTDITVNPAIDKKCNGGVNVTETNSTAAFTYSVSGTTVNFTNTSTNATAYAWSFGDGKTGTEFAPVHTYASDQTPMTVTLTTAGLGCQVSTKTENLFGSGLICADVLQGVTIAATPTSGIAPLTVALTANVTGTADGYEWTVKDASGNDIAGYPKTTAVLTLTDVILNTIGTYTAYVKASNSTVPNCSVNTDAAPATIQVNQTSCDAVAAFTVATSDLTATFNTAGSVVLCYLITETERLPV